MRFPGEWERHERTIMGWPCRTELWGAALAHAQADYAAVANAIAAFEPVTMIANPGRDAAEARAALTANVTIAPLPIDDSWLRDTGPIYLVDSPIPAGAPAGRAALQGSTTAANREAVHFRFNAWGEKFSPWDADAAVGRLIARELGDTVTEAAIVLEGGSVLADGAGTILTTEQCLLHPSRNPSLSREQIEAALGRYLGAERVLWLGQGLLEDRDTDGHVDLIAAYTPDRRVMLQTVPDGNPNFDNCEENRARLLAAGVEVVEMPHLPYAEVCGETVAVSYMNLYICNGAVIVPVCGADSDPDALAIVAGAFPGREVVGAPGAVIAYGGGGPHCITQQVPEVC